MTAEPARIVSPKLQTTNAGTLCGSSAAEVGGGARSLAGERTVGPERLQQPGQEAGVERGQQPGVLRLPPGQRHRVRAEPRRCEAPTCRGGGGWGGSGEAAGKRALCRPGKNKKNAEMRLGGANKKTLSKENQNWWRE